MFITHLSPLDSEMSAFVLCSLACFPVRFKHTGSIACHLSMTPFDNVSLLDETCPLALTAASLFFSQCLTIFYVCSLSYSSGRQKKKSSFCIGRVVWKKKILSNTKTNFKNLILKCFKYTKPMLLDYKKNE